MFLREHMRIADELKLMVNNDNALDAPVCVLAGVDFLQGKAIKPADQELAKNEGWIWVRKPVSQGD